MGNQGQILIVDDRPYNLKRLSDILKASGYQVRTAVNIELAFLSAASQSPDMILLDIRTPGTEGLDFCRRLKQNPDTANIPVKFINLADEESGPVKNSSNEAAEFITHQFNADDLLARIQLLTEFGQCNLLLEQVRDELDKKNEEILTQIEELQLKNDEIQAQADELIRQNLLLNTILDNLPIGIFMVNSEDGSPQIVNNHAKLLMGRGLAPEANSKNLQEVYQAYKAGTNQKYPACEMPIILGTQKKYSHIDDMEVERPDGTRIALEVFGCPVFDHNHKNWASLVGFYDITGRKQFEQQLQEAKDHFETIFKLSPDAILVTRLSDGYLINFNTGFTRLTGYSYHDLIDKSTLDIEIWKHPDDRKLAVNELLKHNFCHNMEVTIKAKNGSEKTVMWSATIIKIQGEPHILSGAHDITELKQLEKQKLEMQKQMLHAQKLESIAQIAGGIGHDFNNLSTIILSNLEYFSYLNDENPAVYKKIQNIKTAVMREVVLTEQLLAYSGKASYMIKEFNLNSLITKNLNTFSTVIGKQIHLETSLLNSELRTKGDENQLQQVLLNLISNASEAIGDKCGIIKITTGYGYFDKNDLLKNQLIQKSHPGNYAYVKVTDNGCGMDEVVISQIFEPFFSTKYFGRGLGLSAVQGVITAHLGGIFVDSAPSKGTTITILLPAAIVPAAAEPASIESLTKQTELRFKGTLIVADDEEMLLEISSEMLELAGFKVFRASDGSEALEIFKNNPAVDGLLLDLTMPGLGGVAAAKAIREIDKKVRIVFTSGYYASDKSLNLDSVANNGFIHKPYEMNNLLETIGQVFADLIIKQ